MVYNAAFLQVFEDEIVRIGFNAKLSILRLTWRQHPNTQEYRRGYQQAILVALEKKAKYWLTDSRQVNYLHLADQHWMYATMLPLLTQDKILKFALVLQPETFMMTDRKTILSKIEENAISAKPVMVDFFLDVDSAQQWLVEESGQTGLLHT